MKAFIPLSFLILLTGSLSAQAVEEKRAMSLGTYTSFVISVSDMDVKMAEDVWRDYLKSLGGSDPRKKKGEYFVDNGSLGGVTEGQVDIYSTVERSGNGASIAVWFDLGGGSFLNSQDHSDRVRRLREKWIPEFEEKIRVRRVETEIQAEEKKLQDLAREIDKLEKEQEKLNETIQDCEKKIEEAKKGLELNAQMQDQRRVDITEQQKNVDKVKEKLKKQ